MFVYILVWVIKIYLTPQPILHPQPSGENRTGRKQPSKSKTLVFYSKVMLF